MTIDGQTLRDWGYKSGPWYKDALVEAHRLKEHGAEESEIRAMLDTMAPPEIETIGLRTNSLPIGTFIQPENDHERANVESVIRHMDALMRVPTIVKGAIMPDACPSGSQEGTIPVGGAVACDNAIHPGFH